MPCLATADEEDSSITLNCIQNDSYDKQIKIRSVVAELRGHDSSMTGKCQQQILGDPLEHMKSECDGKPVCGVKKYAVYLNDSECGSSETDHLTVIYSCVASSKAGCNITEYYYIKETVNPTHSSLFAFMFTTIN